MHKRRLIYIAIKRPFLKSFFNIYLHYKRRSIRFRVLTQNIYHSVFNLAWSQGLFPSHAMGKAQGTRLIMCCLEVLPLRPFTFFVYCRMRFLILGLSVGRPEKKKRKKKKWRIVGLGGLVPRHNNMRSLEMTRPG